MNRIVLMGNGLDLDYGLKTRYEDFTNWYYDLRVLGFVGNFLDISSDILCATTLHLEILKYDSGEEWDCPC